MKLHSVTTPNMAAIEGDALKMFDGAGTPQENLIEFAARICYKSESKMGISPNFIPGLMRKGHLDVIEHVWVTVEHESYEDWSVLRMLNRHCDLLDMGYSWLITGNLRVWLDFFEQGVLMEALPILTAIAPSVFAEFDASPVELPDMPIWNVAPTERGSQRVTLLGASSCSATFLLEGISRACTHQLVRHRLASHSQESQRYVSFEKGEWSAIIPPAIAANAEAARVMFDFWKQAETTYRALRAIGIRKEDARFLLLNAAETRIVTTMNFDGWEHFLWLRAVDRAAQWEIRAMGQQVLEQLYQIAPERFGELWQKYQEMES